MSEDTPYLRQGAERAPRVVQAPDPEDDRRAVAVRLMGPPDAVERLATVTLPGFRAVVRKVIDDGSEVIMYGYVIASPDHHDYLSTYCQHEAGNPDPSVAAHLHALCASTVGLCGEKVPATCKICRTHCLCPGHAEDHKTPVTLDG